MIWPGMTDKLGTFKTAFVGKDKRIIPDDGLQYRLLCSEGCYWDEVNLEPGDNYQTICPKCGKEVTLISEL